MSHTATTEMDLIAQWVTCPRCGKEAGEQCTKPNGDRVAHSHRERQDRVLQTAHSG